MRFRKKPVEVEAIQWKGNNAREVKAWVTECLASVGVHKGTDGTFAPDELALFVPRRSTHMTETLWQNIENGWGEDITAAIFDYLHETYVGVKTGQWVIFGTKGEFYPCDSDDETGAPINYEAVQ